MHIVLTTSHWRDNSPSQQLWLPEERSPAAQPYLFHVTVQDLLRVLASLRMMQVYLIRPPDGCQNREPRRLKYDPMPTTSSIRLLKIHPLESCEDNFDLYRQIHCSMVVEDLANIPQYDALSYTWGCPLGTSNLQQEPPSNDAWKTAAFDVCCDGQRVSVTPNLYTALLALRY